MFQAKRKKTKPELQKSTSPEKMTEAQMASEQSLNS
jgi:hypothetical protein